MNGKATQNNAILPPSAQSGEPWNAPLDALFAALTSSAKGLSAIEAEARLARFGPNNAMEHRQRPLWRQIVDRLANPLVLILLFASALSAWTGAYSSFAIIVVIITLSVALDVFQQVRAEGTVEALRRSVALTAQAMRDGLLETVTLEKLVPGDIVQLVAGDIVPADCRMLEGRDFFVNQALLTGESYPVEKRAEDAPMPVSDAGSASGWLFMGTSVISGTCQALVCRTGRKTQFGGIAGDLVSKRPRDAFERGIQQFGYLMLRLTIFLVLFVLAANLAFQRPLLESLLFAIALAVGLTPELLPMVVTVTLAKGAARMAKQQVIVKRLAAVHDLGAMDVLCTDKTGTLTESRVELIRAIGVDGNSSDEVFRLAFLNSSFESGIKSPLDAAVLAFQFLDVTAWHKIDEVPFDFERRRVSVLVDDGQNRLLTVKGAPEDLIQLSSTMRTPAAGTDQGVPVDRAMLLARFEQLGQEGFRALGIAVKRVDQTCASVARTDETDLTFVGFAVFVDPPKPDAAAAIRNLVAAGVDVKILTGDNERITVHICQQIGVPVTGVLSGPELSTLSPEALKARLAVVNLFCRVTPQQKQQVLLALKQSGKVVGFLGDGINDASALHAADVGISVDTGADVAKAAADLVLLQHDLSAIHSGVLEGRRTVENVTKYILMGASSNLGNMISMAAAALFLPFLPMLPTQVLLNNLLYDFSEIGVPFDTVDPEALEKPAHWDLAKIVRYMLILGPVSSLFDFLTFAALYFLYNAHAGLFQTGWFMESLATQSLVIFVIRTRGLPWLSRPHPILTVLTLTAVSIGMAIPLTPLGPTLGFVTPPPSFALFLIAAVGSYLLIVIAVRQIVRP
jgi:P-type Mg2+ transporter